MRIFLSRRILILIKNSLETSKENLCYMWKIRSEDRQTVMEFSKRAQSCVENSVFFYFFCDLAERNTAALFYLVAQMVEGEEVIKIFCFFPDILFPFDFTHFLPPPVDGISFIFAANFEYFSGILFHNSRAFPRYKIKLRTFDHLVANSQWVVPSCRLLVACLCPDRSDFDPRPVSVEFAVGNVAVGQCYFACFGCVSLQCHSISAGNASILVSPTSYRLKFRT